jgi:hypothetical protein
MVFVRQGEYESDLILMQRAGEQVKVVMILREGAIETIIRGWKGRYLL